MATGITISRHGPNEQVIVARCLTIGAEPFKSDDVQPFGLRDG